MTDKKINALASEKLSKLIFKLSAPAIAGLAITGVYNFVDTIFMGKLGTEALAASTIGYPYFTLLTTIAVLISVGAASFQARLLGQKKYDLAEKLLSTSLITSIILGLVITLLSLPFIKNIALICGASSFTLAPSMDYIRFLAIGAVFPILNLTVNSLLRGEGSAMESLIGMSIGGLINVILDPILMFGMNLGVSGAAIATVLSQMVSCAVLSSFYLRKKTIVKLSLKKFSPSKEIYAGILQIGIPAFLYQLLTTISMIIANMIAKEVSDTLLAAVGSFGKISWLAFSVLTGVGHGFQPIAGYSYGAKNFTRLKDAIKLTNIYTTIFASFSGLIFYFFATPIASIFSKDLQVIEFIAFGLKTLSFSMPFMGFFFVSSTLFEALGHARNATILSILRVGVFYIGVMILLTDIYQGLGLMASSSVANILSVVLAFFLFLNTMKKLNSEENKLPKLKKAL